MKINWSKYFYGMGIASLVVSHIRPEYVMWYMFGGVFCLVVGSLEPKEDGKV